jgi:hypothetical protein
MPVNPYLIEKFGLLDWIVVDSNRSFQMALSLLSQKGISLSRAFLVEHTSEGTFRSAYFLKIIQTLSDADPIWKDLPVCQLPLKPVGRAVQMQGDETSRSLVNWLNNHSEDILIVLNGEQVQAILTSNSLSASFSPESIVGDVLTGNLHDDPIPLAGNPMARPTSRAEMPTCPVCRQPGYYEFNPLTHEFLCKNPNCRHIVRKL